VWSLLDGSPALAEAARRGGRWLEPSAGEGALVAAVDHWRARQPTQPTHPTHPTQPGTLAPLWWDAVEARLDCAEALRARGAQVHSTDLRSFVAASASGAASGAGAPAWAVAFGNPPYTHAEEHIELCMRVAARVVVLLRLNFLGSAKRADWLRAHTPDIAVLPNRPSFHASGRTDSVEYAWFTWPGEGRYTVLPPVPKPARVSLPRPRIAGVAGVAGVTAPLRTP
jgi:hypothetical protein